MCDGEILRRSDGESACAGATGEGRRPKVGRGTPGLEDSKGQSFSKGVKGLRLNKLRRVKGALGGQIPVPSEEGFHSAFLPASPRAEDPPSSMPFFIEGCRNRNNPFHVCSDFCKTRIFVKNPKPPPPDLPQADPSILVAVACSQTCYLGVAIARLAEEPAEFHIPDVNIEVVSQDIGSRSFLVHCMCKQPPVDKFVEWMNTSWSNLSIPDIDILDFSFFLLRFCFCGGLQFCEAE